MRVVLIAIALRLLTACNGNGLAHCLPRDLYAERISHEGDCPSSESLEGPLYPVTPADCIGDWEEVGDCDWRLFRICRGVFDTQVTTAVITPEGGFVQYSSGACKLATYEVRP